MEAREAQEAEQAERLAARDRAEFDRLQKKYGGTQ
jgi:hypothetical protein